MSLEGLLIGIVLITITLVAVILPLIAKHDTRPHEAILEEKQRERLNVYYSRVVRNLRDLDEDHDLGKIITEDYTAERELWVQRGIQALKALDNLQHQEVIAMNVEDNAAVDKAISEAIEAAVASAKTRL